jgi:hypothetical protein
MPKKVVPGRYWDEAALARFFEDIFGYGAVRIKVQYI